jgi:hypothetical protein
MSVNADESIFGFVTIFVASNVLALFSKFAIIYTQLLFRMSVSAFTSRFVTSHTKEERVAHLREMFALVDLFNRRASYLSLFDVQTCIEHFQILMRMNVETNVFGVNVFTLFTPNTVTSLTMMAVLDTPFIFVMGILTSVSVRANST